MWGDIKVDRWEAQIDIKVPKSALVVKSEAKEEQGYDPIAKIGNALKNPLAWRRLRDW